MPFPRVKEARELLKARAQEILDMQMRIIQEALAAQEFAVAAEANQFLLEHIPQDEGLSVLETSVDIKKKESGPSGPSIQIGIALGGANQRALTAGEVIDAEDA